MAALVLALVAMPDEARPIVVGSVTLPRTEVRLKAVELATIPALGRTVRGAVLRRVKKGMTLGSDKTRAQVSKGKGTKVE